MKHAQVKTAKPEGQTEKASSLRVSQPGDRLEVEADRVADEVLRSPVTGGLSGAAGRPPVQRKCAACEAGGAPCPACLMSAGRGAMDARETLAPPIIHHAIRSSGQPLDTTARTFFEPRIGHDFSQVRVHTDSLAAEACQVLNARAFTVGRQVFFDAGEYRPGNDAGRRLIAHELAHTMQQSRSVPKIQRFVRCTHPRALLDQCPKRQNTSEGRDSRREPMIVEHLESPVRGWLVRNFGVARSLVKSSAKKHPNWPLLINAVSRTNTKWKLLGLSDCHGNDQKNMALRQARADAVRAALPPAATTQIMSASAAPSNDCITDNTTPIDRAFNRSVLIALLGKDVTMQSELISGTRHVPKPESQPTESCSSAKKSEIAAALPIAVAMVENALKQPKTPEVARLLQKYFKSSKTKTYLHVLRGLKKTLSGLKSDLTIQCENKNAPNYNKSCSSTKTTVTVAYIISTFGYTVHLCEPAFGRSDLSLAETLVHEFSHIFDFTDDEEYCPTGCSSSLTSRDAINNADSYAGFAKESYLL